MHDVVLEFFATNTPDPYHWTLNSCFGALLSVWGHLEPFCYCMKLATKRAKLVQVMQKFMPRCLVRSFCNEHSRSTPLDPKLMFGCISLHSGAFWNSFATIRNLAQNAPNWVQSMQKFMPRCRARIFRNERSQSTPLDHKLVFWCVFWCVGAFGTILLLYETCCKTHQTGTINAKVCAMCLVRVFCNEHSWSKPLDHKLMFWCVSFRSGAFWNSFATSRNLVQNTPNWSN